MIPLGILAAFSSGDGSPTGGTISESGDFTYHAFTTSGTFRCFASKVVEVLAVAGGGGGGYRFIAQNGNPKEFGGGGGFGSEGQNAQPQGSGSSGGVGILFNGNYYAGGGGGGIYFENSYGGTGESQGLGGQGGGGNGGLYTITLGNIESTQGQINTGGGGGNDTSGGSGIVIIRYPYV
jgi:hypothetical protein